MPSPSLTALPSMGFCSDDFVLTAKSSSCRIVDMTFAQEAVYLCLVPGVIFCLFTYRRLIRLIRREAVVRKSALLPHGKILFASLNTTSSLVALITWEMAHVKSKDLVSAALLIELLTSILLSWLSYQEHYKAVRESTISSVYLLFTLLFGFVKLRSWVLVSLVNTNLPLFLAFCVGQLARFALLWLENVNKEHLLLEKVPMQVSSTLVSYCEEVKANHLRLVSHSRKDCPFLISLNSLLVHNVSADGL